jgi:hypothetical protein
MAPPPNRPRRWYEAGKDADVRVAHQFRAPTPSGQPACPPPNPYAPPGIAPRGQDIALAKLVRSIQPPRIEKIGASQDFRINSNSLILPAGAGATVVLPSFTLPTGQVGWLQQFSLYTLAPDATLQAQWKVRINSGPVPGFDNLLNPPGIANLLIDGEDDMRVRLDIGVTIDVLITNLGGSGPWTVGALLAGWHHPLAAEKRAWGLEGY